MGNECPRCHGEIRYGSFAGDCPYCGHDLRVVHKSSLRAAPQPDVEAAIESFWPFTQNDPRRE